MFDRKHLHGLLWKEARVIMPLAAAVAAIAAMLYAVTLFLPGQREGVFFAYLLLFPNLLALGVPSLQIGHEEETGTLRWQRSLPVGWAVAAASKFLVALAACSLGWLVCASGMLVAFATGQIAMVPQVEFAHDPGGNVFQAVTFTLMLLCCSFLTSWLFRSPAVALLAVLPLAAASTAAAIYAASQVEDVLGWSKYAGPSAATTGVVHLLLAMILFMAAARMAYVRWSRPGEFHWLRSSRGRRGSAEAAGHAAYIPSRAIPAASPGLRRMLIWQSLRQAIGIYPVVAVLIGAGTAMQLLSHHQLYSEWFILALIASAGLLGTASFAGDTTGQRYRFLAERGLSRWTLWWTRMVVPATGLLIVLMIVTGVGRLNEPGPHDPPSYYLAVLPAGAFAIAQLVAMWARRPVVAYMGAVVLYVFGLILSALVYTFYPDYLGTAFVAVAVLVIATLRLSRRWSEGDQSQGYQNRMIGWLGLAALAIVLPIAAHRWWTTPAAMPEWRRQIAASAGSLTPLDAVKPHHHLLLTARYVSGDSYRLSEESLEELRRVIAWVRRGNAPAFTSPELPRAIDRSVQSALQPAAGSTPERRGEWAEGLLMLALHGVEHLPDGGLLAASDMADLLELAAARGLADPAVQELLGAERWRELAGRLRTPEERREERRRAILNAWSAYQAAERDELTLTWTGRPAAAVGYPYNSHRRQLLAAERRRSHRFFDLATKFSLDQLKGSLPDRGSSAERARLHYWKQALDSEYLEIADPDDHSLVNQSPTRAWNQQFEETVQSVRRAAGY